MLKRLTALLLTVMLMGSVVLQINPAMSDEPDKEIWITPVLLPRFGLGAGLWYSERYSRTMYAAYSWLDVALAGQSEAERIIASAVERNEVYVAMDANISAYFFGEDGWVVCGFIPATPRLIVKIYTGSVDNPMETMNVYKIVGKVESFDKIEGQYILMFLESSLGY